MYERFNFRQWSTISTNFKPSSKLPSLGSCERKPFQCQMWPLSCNLWPKNTYKHGFEIRVLYFTMTWFEIMDHLSFKIDLHWPCDLGEVVEAWETWKILCIGDMIVKHFSSWIKKNCENIFFLNWSLTPFVNVWLCMTLDTLSNYGSYLQTLTFKVIQSRKSYICKLLVIFNSWHIKST